MSKRWNAISRSASDEKIGGLKRSLINSSDKIFLRDKWSRDRIALTKACRIDGNRSTGFGVTKRNFVDLDVAQDLAGELASVKFSIDSSGRTQIEAKDAMKRRGLRSCDIADALGVTFYATGVMGKGAAIFEIVRQQAEELKRQREAIPA